MDHYGNCPKCGESWDDGSIFDALRKHPNNDDISDEDLNSRIERWFAPPYRFSKLIGIEIQGEYDGISYWQCPFCKTTWDRFTGKEVENAYPASNG